MNQEITRGQLLKAIVESTGDYDLALDVLYEVTEGGKGSGRRPDGKATKARKAVGNYYGSTKGQKQKMSLDKFDKRSKDRGRVKWSRGLNRAMGKVAKKAYNADRAIARGLGAKGKGVARLD